MSVRRRTGSRERNCSIFLHSSGCYLPLFRQFQRQAGREYAIKPLTRAASVLQFSGAEYYHWLLEALPRLLLLRDHLAADLTATADPEAEEDLTLILPTDARLYIRDSLNVLKESAAGGLAPFTKLVTMPEHGALAVETLHYADWAPVGHDSAARVGHTTGGGAACPDAGWLR
jgi:hypothetical protein